MNEDFLWLSAGALLGALLFAVPFAADLFRRGRRASKDQEAA
jgi:hypothetical protein